MRRSSNEEIVAIFCCIKGFEGISEDVVLLEVSRGDERNSFFRFASIRTALRPTFDVMRRNGSKAQRN